MHLVDHYWSADTVRRDSPPIETIKSIAYPIAIDEIEAEEYTKLGAPELEEKSENRDNALTRDD